MNPPQIPDDPEIQKKKKFWRMWIWISIPLVIIPPVFGLLGTVFGMIRAFDTMGTEVGADPAEFSESVSVSLATTAGGLIVSFFGILLFILSLTMFLISGRRVSSADSSN